MYYDGQLDYKQYYKICHNIYHITKAVEKRKDIIYYITLSHKAGKVKPVIVVLMSPLSDIPPLRPMAITALTIEKVTEPLHSYSGVEKGWC